jgi:hypothetical protein
MCPEKYEEDGEKLMVFFCVDRFHQQAASSTTREVKTTH